MTSDRKPVTVVPVTMRGSGGREEETQLMTIGALLDEPVAGVAGEGRNQLRVLLVGGDKTRAVLAKWPPWYEILHASGNTPTGTFKRLLASDRTDHVIILMKWKDERLLSLTRKHAKCPVHYWPKGLGELVGNIAEVIKPKEKPAKAAPPEMVQTAPVRKPRAATWTQTPTPPVPSTTAEAAPPPIVEEPVTKAAEPAPSAPEGPMKTKPKDNSAYDRVAALASGSLRKNAWTKDELGMLVCAWEECNSDADLLVTNFRALGGKRSVTAIWFALLRVLATIGTPMPEKMAARFRKLTEADRKESTLGIVEIITKEKGSTALAAGDEPNVEVEGGPEPGEPVHIYDPERIVDLVAFEVLSVKLGKKTRADAFDAIAALVRR